MTTVVAQGHNREGWDTEQIVDYDDAIGYANQQQITGVGTVSIVVDGEYILEGLDLKNSSEDRITFLEKMEELLGVWTFKNEADLQQTASALYDGGWRAEDIDEMVATYDISRKEAEKVCELLRQYAEKEE